MKMRIYHRGLILVGVPLLIEIVLIGALSYLLYDFAQERVRETRYRRCTSELVHLLTLVSTAPLILATGVQAHNDRLFAEYEREKREIQDSIEELRAIIGQIPELPANQFKTLSTSINGVLGVTDQILANKEQLGEMSSIEQMRGFQQALSQARHNSYRHMEELYPLADKMTRTAQTRLENNRHLQSVFLVSGLVANILMAIGLGIFYRRGILERISTITKNTIAMSSGKPLAKELSGDDEIAQFDKAFHSIQQELLAAAGREQELFDNASDVICVLNADYAFERVNPASKKDWGVEAEMLRGKSLEQLLLEEDLDAAYKSIEESRRTNSPANFEARIKVDEQASKTGLWSIFWSQEEQKLFCIVHDVTERRRIELAKKRFLTLISSDLRQPLARIQSNFKKIVQLDELNAMGKEKLDMAQRAVSRLLVLVNDLLQVTQMDSGEFELHKEQHSIDDLFARSAADVEALYKQKKLAMEIQPHAGTAFFDQDRLMQVLVNLLSNAIKFSPEGSKISLSATPGADGLLILKVQDQGRGVPDSQKQAIFEKFQQVEAADGKRKAGTGLGLPICKKIIEEHGGTIGVSDNEGGGSSFWFTLPATQETDQAHALRRASTISTNSTNSTDSVNTADSVNSKNPRIATNSAVPAGPGTCSAGALPREMEPAKAQKAGPLQLRVPLLLKGLILIGFPAAIGLSMVAFLSQTLFQVESTRSYELQQRKIALAASRLAKSVVYSTGAIVGQTQNLVWANLHRIALEWSKNKDELQGLVTGDEFAREELRKFTALNTKLTFYKRSLYRQESGQTPGQLMALLRQKFKYLPAVVGANKHLRAIIDHAESNEFASPEKEMALRQTQLSILGIGLAFNIVFSGLLALFFSRGISRRILVMADNASRFVSGDPMNQAIGGQDELADLDNSFHHMAAILSEARQKERAVFDNSRDVLCIVSPDGRFLELNAAVDNSWGYSRKELLESTLEAIIAPEDLQAAKTALLESPEGGQNIQHESRICKKDGSIIHVLWSASKETLASNTFCVVHDISDRKELEQLRQDFLGMVTHDLRTPLTSIRGVAALIEAGTFGEVSESGAECVDDVLRNSRSLSELINDILDLEKWNAGKMQLSLEPTSISSIIELTLKQLQTALVKVQIQSAGDLEDCLIDADKERLSRAIANLMKYMVLKSAGGASSEIRLEITSVPSAVELRISGAAATEIAAAEFGKLGQQSKTEMETAQLKDESFHVDLALPLAAKTIESHGGKLSFAGNNGRKNVEIKVELTATRRSAA